MKARAVNLTFLQQLCLPCIRIKSKVRAREKARFRAEEIVKFRRVVGSDWLEYIYNV